MIFKKSSFLILLFIYFASPLHANRGDYFTTYIEATAKSKLGKLYEWGGNGPYKYDCSGFTKEVFELNGIEIPRNSWKQAEVGEKVDMPNLQKGDLVFFTSKNHTKVDHVGIYLGNGQFIHASRFHHQIVISPLREYRRYFKWGRRLS